MSKPRPNPLLVPDEFNRLIGATRMRPDSRSTQAARLVLVEGLSQAGAARRTGLTRAGVSAAVAAVRRRLAMVMIPCPAELAEKCRAWIRAEQAKKGP